MRCEENSTVQFALSMPDPDGKIISDFIRRQRLHDLSEYTIRNYVRAFYYFLRDVRTPIEEITKEQIEDWFLDKRETLSAASIKLSLISISLFMQFVHGKAGKGMVDIKVKVPFTAVRDEELLTRDEVKQLLSAAACERDRAIVALLFSSGARIGEVCGLKLRDVSFSRYGATLELNGKTGRRIIDIYMGVPEIQAWVNIHPLKNNPEAPLFVSLQSSGGRFLYTPLSSFGISSMLHRLAERCGITKKVNPHAFRHARATDTAKIMSVADMNEFYGWTPGSNMSQVYVHSSRERIRGILAEEEGLKVPEVQKQIPLSKQCPRCGAVNSADALYCCKCSLVLDENFAYTHKNEIKAMCEK